MQFFECTIARTVITDDLKVSRQRETVYVQAQDDKEASNKARHPANWLKSAGRIRTDESSFLLMVEDCRRLADDEVKVLKSGFALLPP